MRLLLLTLPALVLTACGNPQSEPAAEIDHSGHGDMAGTMIGSESDGPVAQQETAIDIRASWMRPHPEGRDVTAAYVVVRLSEGTEDLLTEVRIDEAERVEIHGHFVGADGVMQMREIGPQPVTDEGPLVFTPGGRHLMVFGLAPVSEGETVNGTLVFQNAGEVPVTLAVRSMPPGMPTEY
ncbi:copper chaperone PCu(A)C [Hyphobacterium sp. HN65]|uniref:Copper chaperone PCu(A)C n=1 Tax=Hyphobacterium lacteum TaxID=3116575 RepID=A0ABU7LSQ9_9PROT|nr:copper chaperone PCu(A)C [Hyphobacterium sp. HN65]MEE2526681.1 copper chaperone PCu(A)C [Hyphobacterium sp. HN65]